MYKIDGKKYYIDVEWMMTLCSEKNNIPESEFEDFTKKNEEESTEDEIETIPNYPSELINVYKLDIFKTMLQSILFTPQEEDKMGIVGQSNKDDSYKLAFNTLEYYEIISESEENGK
jgi:hypothetical protein